MEFTNIADVSKERTSTVVLSEKYINNFEKLHHNICPKAFFYDAHSAFFPDRGHCVGLVCELSTVADEWNWSFNLTGNVSNTFWCYTVYYSHNLIFTGCPLMIFKF